MRMRLFTSARLLAGALLLAAASAGPLRAERLILAAERPDGSCPADSPVLGIVRLGAALPEGSAASRCVFLVSLAGVSDAEIDESVSRLAALRSAAGLMLSLPAGAEPERVVYAVKRVSSIFRSGSPEGKVALYADQPLSAEAAEELTPYVDALVLRPGGATALRGAGAPVGDRAGRGRSLGDRRRPEGDRGSPAGDAGRRARRGAVADLRRRRRARAAGQVPHGRRLARPDQDHGDAQGRLPDRGPAVLRREALLAGPPSRLGRLRRGSHRAVGWPVRTGLRREPRERRAPRLRAQGRRGPDPGPLQGLPRGGAQADGQSRRRDPRGRRRGRDPGPDGRRDHRARAGVGRGPAREVPELLGRPGHLAAVSDRRVPGLAGLDDPGALLRGQGKARGLGVARVLPERSQVEGPHDPPASDPPAREGHHPAARHPPVRGIRLRARRRDHGRRAPGLPDPLPSAHGRSRQAPLPRHGVDRPGDVRDAAPRVDPAQPQGRHALQHPDRVLPRGSVPARRGAAAGDPGPAGLLDRRPRHGDRALRHDDERPDRPARLRGASGRGLRLEAPDRPRHGPGAALPGSGSRQPGRARRRERLHAAESLRPDRSLLPALGRLPPAAAGAPVLRLRPLRQEQAAVRLLRGRAAVRQLHRSRAPRHAPGSGRRPLRTGHPVHGAGLPQRRGDRGRAHQAPGRVRAVERGLPDRAVPQDLAGLLHAVGQLPARRGHGPPLRDARGHADHRRGAAALVEPERLQRGRQGKLRLAGEVGGLGQSGHLRISIPIRRPTGSTRPRSTRPSTSPSSASSASRSRTSTASGWTGSRGGTSVPSATNKLAGFPAGSVRADRAFLANLSYG